MVCSRFFCFLFLFFIFIFLRNNTCLILKGFKVLYVYLPMCIILLFLCNICSILIYSFRSVFVCFWFLLGIHLLQISNSVTSWSLRFEAFFVADRVVLNLGFINISKFWSFGFWLDNLLRCLWRRASMLEL